MGSFSTALTLVSTMPRIARSRMVLNTKYLTKLFLQGHYFEFENEFEPPKVLPRVWAKQQFHYDNVASAMLTLFAVQTTEGWPA